ncbi:hypothetical protein D3C85_802190 [compost metagenome]
MGGRGLLPSEVRHPVFHAVRRVDLSGRRRTRGRGARPGAASAPDVAGPVRPDPRPGLLVRRHPAALRLGRAVRHADALHVGPFPDPVRRRRHPGAGDASGRNHVADGQRPGPSGRGPERRIHEPGRGRRVRQHRRLSQRLAGRPDREPQGLGHPAERQPVRLCLRHRAADDAGHGPVQGRLLPRPHADGGLCGPDRRRRRRAGPAGRAGVARDHGRTRRSGH